MKKYFIGLTLLIFLILTRMFILRPYDAMFELYKSKEGHNINTILGIVPQKFINSYHKKNIVSTDRYNLYYLEDNSTAPETFYVLEIDNKHYFITGFPFLFGDMIGLESDFSNIHGYLVNLKNFNKYIHILELQDRNDILDEYFKFLGDFGSYRILYSSADIATLKEQYKKAGISPIVEKEINYHDLAFTNSDNTYVWFEYKGLIRFSFEFKEDELISVESLRIGFLGIEKRLCL